MKERRTPERDDDSSVDEHKVVTLQSLAEVTGVSVSTVSRVLNKVPNAASPETSRRILETAARLGYVPNAQAAALRTGSSNTVGLIVADISNPFFAAIAVALEQSLLRAGLGLVVANTANSTELERRYVTTMLQNRVDALVVAPTSNDAAHLEEARRRGVRLVLIDSPIDGLDVDCVLVDDESAIHRAANHLLALGHRRIGYISGHGRILSDRERLAGRQRALAEAGVDDDPDLVVNGDFTELGGFQATSQLLSMRTPPTAIIASNNFMAVGAIRAARAKGVDIPGALSLVSFDDMDWFDLVSPGITATRQPMDAIGSLVSDLVVGTSRPVRGVPYILPTTLVIRGSTSAPAP